MAKRDKVRRDSRGRALHVGESQRKDGKYMFKYVVDGKTYFLTSWKLLMQLYHSSSCLPYW